MANISILEIILGVIIFVGIILLLIPVEWKCKFEEKYWNHYYERRK